ncbi:hypothetical protein V8E53_004521 [Lactarius tabidus]
MVDAFLWLQLPSAVVLVLGTLIGLEFRRINSRRYVEGKVYGICMEDEGESDATVVVIGVVAADSGGKKIPQSPPQAALPSAMEYGGEERGAQERRGAGKRGRGEGRDGGMQELRGEKE